jgi:hypothetical protein
LVGFEASKARKQFFFEKKHAPGLNWGTKKLLLL